MVLLIVFIFVYGCRNSIQKRDWDMEIPHWLESRAILSFKESIGTPCPRPAPYLLDLPRPNGSFPCEKKKRKVAKKGKGKMEGRAATQQQQKMMPTANKTKKRRGSNSSKSRNNRCSPGRV